ncbi:hypothetical protein [Streptomyces sp. NPDC004726]
MVKPTPGYWCECRTGGKDGTAPTRLAAFDAHSAGQAVRWIAIALNTITSALDDNSAAQAWQWLYEGRQAMAEALHQGKPCNVSFTTTGQHITWTARPAHFLPLAHRQASRLPTCSDQFSPPDGQ